MGKNTLAGRPARPSAPAPADPHLIALLTYIGGGHPSPEHLQEVEVKAREILAAPIPFDESADTPSVDVAVLNGDWLRSDRGDGWARNRNLRLDAILDVDDVHEDITASPEELRDLLYSAIAESALMGASLMFLLLKGGPR
jgi:hypothetical protein